MSDRRDIDRSFEEALGALLRRSLEPGGAACPSPDTLGAHLTGRLTAAETETIDHHLAGCDLCQQHLVALAAMEPAPEPEAPPEPIVLTVEVADVASPDPPVEHAVETAPEVEPETLPFAVVKPPRRARRTIRWLAAPLALAATAVLGVLLTRRLEPELGEVSRRASGVAAKRSAAPGEPQRMPDTAREAEKKAEATPEPPAAPPALADVAPAAPAVEAAPQGAASGFGAAAEPQSKPAPPAAEAPQRDAKGDKDEREQGAESAPPVAPLGGGDAGRERAEEAPRVPQASREGSSASLDAAPPRAKTAELGALARQAPASPSGAAAAAPAVEHREDAETWIAVPSSAVRWRLRGATIDRSDDGGTTWRTQLVGTKRLTAGAASSPKVCWVVGAGGTVLRTIDGTHWTRLALPATDDVVRVSASGGRSATVDLAGGQRLATTDGGRTWSKR